MAILLPHYVLSFSLDLPFLFFPHTPPDYSPTFIHLMAMMAPYMHPTVLGYQPKTNARSLDLRPTYQNRSLALAKPYLI